jgi:hypothetical protein
MEAAPAPKAIDSLPVEGPSAAITGGEPTPAAEP